MSGTTNEFDEPGANYPDSEAKDPGAQERRDDGSGASDAVPGRTQDGPVLAQNQATELERLDGIVVQTRADLAGADVATVERSLRRRLSDAGIELAEGEIEALARDLSER